MKGYSVKGVFRVGVSVLGMVLATQTHGAGGDLLVRAGVSAMDPDTRSESFSSISRSAVRLDTDAQFSGAINETVEMEIDPVVFSLGVGYRF